MDSGENFLKKMSRQTIPKELLCRGKAINRGENQKEEGKKVKVSIGCSSWGGKL